MDGCKRSRLTLLLALVPITLIFASCAPESAVKPTSEKGSGSTDGGGSGGGTGGDGGTGGSDGSGDGTGGTGDGTGGTGDGTGGGTALTCPEGYILVPKDDVYTTSDFCVMKFEAKPQRVSDDVIVDGDSRVSSISDFRPVSTDEYMPWAYISRNEAVAACDSLGANFDLISNNHWQTLAQNAEVQPENWTGGAVGTGCLFTGNAESTNCGYNHGSGFDYGVASSRNARAKLKLSNGEEIYDLAGNYYEYVKEDGANFGVLQYTALLTANDGTDASLGSGPVESAKYYFGSLMTYSSANEYAGLGGVDASASGGPLLRGGDFNLAVTQSGVFTAWSDGTSTVNDSSRNWVSFRCVYSE